MSLALLLKLAALLLLASSLSAFTSTSLSKPSISVTAHRRVSSLAGQQAASSPALGSRLFSTPADANSLKTRSSAGATQASHAAANLGLSLGAPTGRPTGGHYLTSGGVQVTSNVSPVPYNPNSSFKSGSAFHIEELIERLDSHRGVLLQSSYEFPGRYARWSIGFSDPPLAIEGKQGEATVVALNKRGLVLLPAILGALEKLKGDGVLSSLTTSTATDETWNAATGDSLDAAFSKISMKIAPSTPGSFSEEDRSRQPSLFSVIRCIRDLMGFKSADGQLGLYGSFGYDLTFEFEPIEQTLPRDPKQRDLLLYLPDEILVVDQDKRDAWRISYDFAYNGRSTTNIPRETTPVEFQPYDGNAPIVKRDTPKGTFAQSVEKAKREFAVGNLFEAVISQTFRNPLPKSSPPSMLFRRLRARNPSPYGFLMNLGQQEYLVGASPEMFVRVEEVDNSELQRRALRVETCPISGTVARGDDALSDAANIVALLSNKKEESELTMCTDVDRNDKSRICEAGSVKVIGRRQIEMYSRLIHTVDHVEGYLRPEYDALDAFLGHTWSVTVCGSPKAWATQFVEKTENSARAWYGGAVGLVGFDGSLNTGLTLRTVRVHKGVAEVRAGATLLYDSNPVAEEQETELKASAMIDAVVNANDSGGGHPDGEGDSQGREQLPKKRQVGAGKKILIVDHQDSFVHTLGNYFRQTGADVKTLRSGPSTQQAIDEMAAAGNAPDLVVLSPGPGNPKDFDVSGTLDVLKRNNIPAFGVCLGLQGMVEHFGGVLGVLSYPMHGKPSPVTLTASSPARSIFSDLPLTFEVARYHSLHGLKDRLPSCLEVTALTDDGVVMGVQHKTLPYAAVQFHPESILTSPAHGIKMVENAIEFLTVSGGDGAKQHGRGGVGDSGAKVVGELEKMQLSELTALAKSKKMTTPRTKSGLVMALALHAHNKHKVEQGDLVLKDLPKAELTALKRSMLVKGSAKTKASAVELIEASFKA
jgi:anthranilate synthase